MYTKEEKIFIIGSLFHDIGKFVQRCTSKYKSHQEIGKDVLDEYKDQFLKILENDKESFKRVIDLVLKHHNRNENDNLINILRTADHLSASQRVDLDYNEEPGEKWSHIYLSSLFSKIRLNSKADIGDLKYYKHEILTNENYDAMIPRFDSEEEAKEHQYRYKESDLNQFKEELKSVLNFYKEPEDFDPLVNLLLVLLEKYLWCIPDFTGNDETDISLYNHIKDTTALGLCILRDENKTGKINLIVGDIPGIQNYIFGVENRKAAKMLRGRSIFIQILSRNFASLFLNRFKLPETNLIMLAGGKFYILAENSEDFEKIFYGCIDEIQNYLKDNFIYELGFSAGYATFNANDFKNDDFQFGKIIEKAVGNLNINKQKLFINNLKNENSDYSQFIVGDYLVNDDLISDNTKCYLTSKPIMDSKGISVKFSDEEEKKNVYKQSYHEYLVGEKVVHQNVIIYLNDDLLSFSGEKITNLSSKTQITKDNKVIINPDLETILKVNNDRKDVDNLLRNSRFFTVANYVSFDGNNILKFDEMSQNTDGAEYLTLIKGDIDELGMIMSFGLERDIDTKENIKDLNSISRITTLSHHIKYFFSFFTNGFMKKYEETNGVKVYIIFAGGDDIMLICNQINAIKLLNDFNNAFKEFACDNHEVHISYSITHFKHSTPIKLVAEYSEENQKTAKKNIDRPKYISINEMLKDKECFYYNKNKNSTYIFNSVVKNEELALLEMYCDKLEKWVRDDLISTGVLRNLLSFAEMLRDYKDDPIKNSSKLMCYPYLTYSINRFLKNDKGGYKDKLKNVKADEFFEEILSINKSENYNKIENILYPACCGAIYKLRKL